MQGFLIGPAIEYIHDGNLVGTPHEKVSACICSSPPFVIPRHGLLCYTTKLWSIGVHQVEIGSWLLKHNSLTESEQDPRWHHGSHAGPVVSDDSFVVAAPRSGSRGEIRQLVFSALLPIRLPLGSAYWKLRSVKGPIVQRGLFSVQYSAYPWSAQIPRKCWRKSEHFSLNSVWRIWSPCKLTEEELKTSCR